MSLTIDLVVLVADADAEWTLRTLLSERTQALGIHAISSLVIRDPGRDPGVFLRCHDLLRPYVYQATYALVLLDREGSGREGRFTALEMEIDLEKRLQQNGWINEQGRSRSAAIVLDPELEVWVWSASPHVPGALGLDDVGLRSILDRLPLLPNGKPRRPKEAMLAALRSGKKPHSPGIFIELARNVSLQAHEPAFDKLCATLLNWFPAQE
jgi:hypothetical protein